MMAPDHNKEDENVNRVQNSWNVLCVGKIITSLPSDQPDQMIPSHWSLAAVMHFDVGWHMLEYNERLNTVVGHNNL